MATTDISSSSNPFEYEGQPAPQRRSRREVSPAMRIFSMFASLRLTVVLLGLLVFLVFAGTLAQKDYDVWYVVNNAYFRVWVATVELQTIPTFIGVIYPNQWEIPGAFPFPGGFTIGVLMAINLLAAHTLRFKATARGKTLVWGLVLLGVGLLASTFEVLGALDSASAATISSEFAEFLWNLVRGAFAGVSLACAYGLTLAWKRIRWPEWLLLAACVAGLLATAVWLFINPEWRIDDSGMRVIWQLAQVAYPVAILLGSCWLLFGKRAGVVVLHAGVAVLMGHELYTAVVAQENLMMIAEGETTSSAFDVRESELAFIDHSPEEVDRVVVVPERLLAQAMERSGEFSDGVIRHPELPFDVRVVEYHQNSDFRRLDSPTDSPATTGVGLEVRLRGVRPNSGLTGGTDVPGAYVELLDKQTQESRGTYLVTNYFSPYWLQQLNPAMIPASAPVATQGEQLVESQGNQYGMLLRYKHVPKPYEVTLHEFKFRRYIGTEKAKDFSSHVTLRDPEHGAEVDFHIWMNNPLRYRGETFYQNSFDPRTEAGTVLQVVKNESWMLPYLAWMLVLLGMVVHFSVSLLRFLRRRVAEAERIRAEAKANRPPPSLVVRLMQPSVVAPLLFGALTAIALGYAARPQHDVEGEMPLQRFAALPVVDEGRVKPIDTLARNMLQVLCARQTVPLSLENKREKLSPSEWFLEAITGSERSRKCYLIRITNLELIDTLGLEPRPEFFRYSLDEIGASVTKLMDEARGAAAVAKEARTPYQRQVLLTHHKLNLYIDMTAAFQFPRSATMRASEGDVARDLDHYRLLEGNEPVRAIIPRTTEGPWQTFFGATLMAVAERIDGRETQSAPLDFARMMAAYEKKDVAEFTRALDSYEKAVAEYERSLERPEHAEFRESLKPVERIDREKVAFETRFNAASPFFYSSLTYLGAFFLSALSWLVWPKTLGRSALAVILVTLLVHTVALDARMYISGRPPITNLYTTAVVNGWFIVIGALVFEAIFRMGIGHFVASLFGFTTLVIAHYLSMDEDTFTVLQAVLDTQFWLFTHVLSINIGYSATILAGGLGAIYLFVVHVLPVASKKQEQQLSRMLYGSICFALLFSFVGTVLGGLWADDSWGRFWGWDPKENGAMMIVLWNALALHARWGGMVTMRGVALLSIVGNMITGWSWFGVNQLSQGLHAYAFRDDLAVYLMIFFASQLLILAVGAFPWDRLRGDQQKQLSPMRPDNEPQGGLA